MFDIDKDLAKDTLYLPKVELIVTPIKMDVTLSSLPLPAIALQTNIYYAPPIIQDLPLDTLSLPSIDLVTFNTPIESDVTLSSLPLPAIALQTDIYYVPPVSQDLPLNTLSLPSIDLLAFYTPVESDVTLDTLSLPSIDLGTDASGLPLEPEQLDLNTLPLPSYSKETRQPFMYTLKSVLVKEGETFYDYTTEAGNWQTDDFPLIPANPSVGDGIYFGSNSPRFTCLRVKVSTPGVGTYTIIWEYWSGTEWLSLGLSIDETDNWQTSGWCRITFSEHPAYFFADSFTVGGVETLQLFWIRARLSSFTSMTTQPRGTIAFVYEHAQRLKNTRMTMNEDPAVFRMTHYPNIERKLYSGVSFKAPFKLVSYVDEATPKPLTTPRVYYSNREGAFIRLNATVTEIGSGWYFVELPAEIVKRNLILRIVAPGTSQADTVYDIVPAKYFNRFGLKWIDLQGYTWNSLQSKTYSDIILFEEVE